MPDRKVKELPQDYQKLCKENESLIDLNQTTVFDSCECLRDTGQFTVGKDIVGQRVVQKIGYNGILKLKKKGFRKE